MNTIRTQIVKIGNSRGIRIPKPFIDQTRLGNEVELAVQRGDNRHSSPFAPTQRLG
jgi:antitoxin component of MazEF toxin-antitoxin module